MRKRLGVAKLAATVCPTSTFLATTMPLTGERIVVYLRSRLGGIQGRFGLLHLGHRHADLGIGTLSIGHRHIDVILRNELLRHERFCTIEFALALRLLVLGPRHIGLRHFKIAGRLVPSRTEWLGIDDRDDVPCLHDGVEIGVQTFDHAGHLGPHLHGDHGIDRTGGGHN